MSAELDKKISDLRIDLHHLRMEITMGKLKNYNKIKQKKKEIAKCLTEKNQKKSVSKN